MCHYQSDVVSIHCYRLYETSGTVGVEPEGVPCHGDVWGVEVWLHAFLTSALGGKWSAIRPGRFTLPPRYPDRLEYLWVMYLQLAVT
jgi:hypothetical protein